jgi:hypothetical protein
MTLNLFPATAAVKPIPESRRRQSKAFRTGLVFQVTDECDGPD